MRSTHTSRLIASALAAGLLAACSSGQDPEPQDTGPTPAASGADGADSRALLADELGDLSVASGPWAGEIAVADGVHPPTNSWITPAVFNPEDRPVFTGTLSARLSDDEVVIGLPQPQAAPKVVMGPHPDHVPLGLESDSYELVAADGLMASVEYRQGDTPVGTLTMAEGWPYVQFTAAGSQGVQLPPGASATDGGVELTVGDVPYQIRTDGEVDGTTLTLEEGQHLFAYAVPEDAETAAALAEGARPLVSAGAEYAVGEDEVSTTYRYETQGGDTVMALLPHHEVPEDQQVLAGGYDSVLGPVRLLAGSQVEVSAPTLDITPSLDLSGLSEEEAAQVQDLLEQDVAELTFEATDSYHGGKELQRAANLYLLARELGQDELATTVRDALVEQLDQWFDPAGCSGTTERCFRYDDTLGGLVGELPSYGSDEFNDHHFHYGHMLYAAGVLATDEPELAEAWAPVADLVVDDIAARESSAAFPQRRVFDEWYGHSWASGTAPFADGNNQESSSEAVNAWAGVYLWATATGDGEAAEQASWLASTEADTTLTYWIDPELPEEFEAPSVSLNWQGKQDFATFFSAEPSAVVGIQFIPMTPTHATYLSRAPEGVTDMVGAVGELTPGQPLVDYALMGQAVVDPEAAAEALGDFGPDDIDPGNSMSYLTAFVLSR